MNLSYKAKQLEQMLEQDLGKLMPVTVLPDKSIAFKNFRVVKSKKGLYELRYLKTNDIIKAFRTKTSALLAAKFYDKNNFLRFNEVINLDERYYNNAVDSEIFQYRIKNTKDVERRDLFQWRYDLTKYRAKAYKEELTRLFKTHF